MGICKTINGEKNMINFGKKRVSVFVVLRYFILSSIILTAISLSIFMHIEYRILESRADRVISEDIKVIKAEEKIIISEFNQLVSDLNFLKHQFISTQKFDDNYTDIVKQWILFSDSKEGYYQIRFVDGYGDEVVRVEQSKDGAYLVNKDDLMKSKKDYFKETCIVGHNTIHISKLVFGFEKGITEYPFKPVLSISSPLYDLKGDYYGTIVVDYLAEHLLGNIKEVSKNLSGSLLVFNSDGEYILRQNESDDFGFSYGKEVNFKHQYPRVWPRITNEITVIDNEDEVFIGKRIDTINGCSKDNIEVINDEKSFVILSHISKASKGYEYFDSSAKSVLGYIFREKKMILIAMQIVSLIIAYIFYKRKITFINLKYFSEYDGLTNILNRRSGIGYLRELINKNTLSDRDACICFLDIDGLKLVNDQLGHDIGDELIFRFVKCVEKCIRKEDLFIRLGGDEFIIALDGANSIKGEEVIHRINMEIKEMNRKSNKGYDIKVSTGLVDVGDKDVKDVDYLIKLADEKMYINKESKR